MKELQKNCWRLLKNIFLRKRSGEWAIKGKDRKSNGSSRTREKITKKEIEIKWQGWNSRQVRVLEWVGREWEMREEASDIHSRLRGMSLGTKNLCREIETPVRSFLVLIYVKSSWLDFQLAFKLGVEFKQSGDISQTCRQRIPDRRSDETEQVLTNRLSIMTWNFQKLLA